MAPDNIVLPLESGDAPVSVRGAVRAAADDRQPVQIHVSSLPGLDGDAEDLLREMGTDAAWPEIVRKVTGREVVSVLQNARRANRTNPRRHGRRAADRARAAP